MGKNIKVISTDKSLSASGGILLAKEALETSALRLIVASSMPKDSFGMEPRTQAQELPKLSQPSSGT
jgi:hypothetical protein